MFVSFHVCFCLLVSCFGVCVFNGHGCVGNFFIQVLQPTAL